MHNHLRNRSAGQKEENKKLHCLEDIKSETASRSAIAWLGHLVRAGLLRVLARPTSHEGLWEKSAYNSGYDSTFCICPSDSWKNPFFPARSKLGDFHVSMQEKITVTMMRGIFQLKYYKCENLGLQAVVLPLCVSGPAVTVDSGGRR
ncbi:unnamed protein product [Protopolystoma xenopodis]|uniref:Serpin domain-containing protein n=1 Tax=Protopolystoma xenopodis TaxID=117903 RepID=A0A448X2V5_9PLAT|nr:unnamed protein product [Protopolystoma xenopodis]